MCREARDGACVGHAKEVTGRTKKSVRARETPAGYTVGGTNTDNCAASACNVQIGDSLYCSQCKAGFVPINGKCVAFSDSSVTTTAGCTKSSGDPVDASSTTCGKCTKTGYFLHKGGCYVQTATPGSTICTAQTTAGVCQTCSEANGFFRNPGAAPTVDSCISCGDATGVAIGNSNTKTYKGVDG